MDEKTIDVAVVAAGKLDDDVPPSERSRQPNCTHRRFGAGIDQPHHFDRGDGIDNDLRKLGLGLGRGAVTGSPACRFFDCPHNPSVRVPQDERSPRADVIQVLVAVDVVEVRPFPAHDEERMTAHGAEGAGGAIHTSGNHSEGAVEGFSTANADRLHRASPKRAFGIYGDSATGKGGRARARSRGSFLSSFWAAVTASDSSENAGLP